MIVKNEKLLPVLAMTVLLLGSISTLYVHATTVPQGKTQSNIITINNHLYNIDELFLSLPKRIIETDEEIETGIALDQLLIHTGVKCPECHHYTIKGEDGYQQTVSWEDIQTGILTDEKRTCFPELPYAFWVRDVIEIEVT